MAEFSELDHVEAAVKGPRFPRRWLQFGFATLFKLVAAAAVLSAWWADRERLTDRIGKLENDQSVLRIALADDMEGVSPLYAGPGSLPPTAPVATLVPQYGAGAYGAAVYGGTGGPGYGATLAPSNVWAADSDLFDFLNEHKDWLKAHFAEDRGWQGFLAKGRPAAVAQSAATPYGASPASQWNPYADPLENPSAGPPAILRVKAPTPPDRGPQVPEPAVAPQASTSRVPLPLEAPQPPAADPPPEFRPLDTPRSLAEAARDKQCLPAVLKLLAEGDRQSRGIAARWLATMVSSAATSAPVLADAANDPDQAVREEALSALATLGPAAKSAAPRLTALLRAGNTRSDPLYLANVLMRIDAQADVVPRFVESLGGQQLEKRFLALQLLSELGRPRAAAAAPAVAELLADEDARMRMEAAAVYSRLADPREAIPVLRDALANEKNRAVKRTLAQAIMRLQNGPQ